MSACRALLLLLAVPLASAVSLPAPVFGSWFHNDDHVVHNMFKRDAPTDGSNYATVGSNEWASGYPTGKLDVAKLPKAWVDALDAAVAAGKIPDIPVATISGSGEPQYAGLQPTDPKVCSSTSQCYSGDDIYQAPDGYIGIGVDDGPQAVTPKLTEFLISQNQRAAHYMIGSNILQYPTEFLGVFNSGDDIAVHTWTHPYMTTLSNLQVVAEIGWTMEIIHNSTGGRVPKYWRPPYGDSDNRVRAVAKEVFGLSGILWNQDTNDWMLGNGKGSSPTKVEAALNKWITGPKSPGLVILEHDLSLASIAAMEYAVPLMQANGWKVIPSTQIRDATAYRNSPSATGAVTPAGILVNGGDAPSGVPNASGGNSTASASASASASAAATSSTGKTSAEIRSASASRFGMAAVVSIFQCVAIAFFGL